MKESKCCMDDSPAQCRVCERKPSLEQEILAELEKAHKDNLDVSTHHLCKWVEKALKRVREDERGKERWIKSSDRKPMGVWSEHAKYLSEDVLFCNDLAIFIGRWNRKKGLWETDEPADEEWVDDVTHWQPLPSFPKAYIQSINN